MERAKIAGILRLVASIITCQLAGLIGSIFTRSSIPTWYVSLEKPSFTPPNWLFAPVWTVLFLLMGVSVFLVWRDRSGSQRGRVALAIFAIQLFLNILWSIVFFGFRSPLAGLIVILILWIAILSTILNFLKVSEVAGILLIPYILWVTFAAVLNASIFALNIT